MRSITFRLEGGESMTRRVLVLNGPNLNLLGIRRTDVYGDATLDEINEHIEVYARNRGIEVVFEQRSSEGELIDVLHSYASGKIDAVILNAGAYSHYSYALRDAIEAQPKPVIEVHLSNTARRESFRHQSVISPVCLGHIGGFGEHSYLAAVEVLHLLFQSGE